MELRLEGVSKVFKNDIFKKPFRALDQVSCQFASGRCTGLLGHNGAGKTTAIRLILGLIKQDAGKVLFNGRALKRTDRAFIGFMPEVNKLAMNLTCYETLNLHLRLFPRTSADTFGKRIEFHLEKVGLSHFSNKIIRHLSKGMARRLAWAQAIIHQPKLLILDEPFSGLDPIGRAHMTEWIRDQKSRGTSIVLCTHDLGTVDDLCDDIHILNRGRLVYSQSHVQLSAHRSLESYEIEVSGVMEQEVRSLADQCMVQAQDPSKYHISTSGFACRVIFHRYNTAKVFAQSALQAGMILNRFVPTPLYDRSSILRYFDQTPLDSQRENGI